MEDDLINDGDERFAAMLGSARHETPSGANVASIAEVSLAIQCSLAEKLTGEKPQVKVLRGDNSESFVIWQYEQGIRVTWNPVLPPVSGHDRE